MAVRELSAVVASSGHAAAEAADTVGLRSSNVDYWRLGRGETTLGSAEQPAGIAAKSEFPCHEVALDSADVHTTAGNAPMASAGIGTHTCSGPAEGLDTSVTADSGLAPVATSQKQASSIEVCDTSREAGRDSAALSRLP